MADARITAASRAAVTYRDGEEAAIQGLTCGVVSTSEGSMTIYGGAPEGATGIYNVDILLV